MKHTVNPLALAERADAAAALLRSLSNRHRLIILCSLLEGERSAGELAEQSGVIPSNLSQHVAKLRREGLVQTRRNGTTIYYRLDSDRVEPILRALHRMLCVQSERTNRNTGGIKHGALQAGGRGDPT